MQKHVRILGWLQILLGILDLLIGLTAFGVLSGIGLLSGDLVAGGLLSALGGLIGIFMLCMAVPNIVCGVGLLRTGARWAVILAVLLGLLNMLKFPWGTAIAFYTFWIAWRLHNDPTGYRR